MVGAADDAGGWTEGSAEGAAEGCSVGAADASTADCAVVAGEGFVEAMRKRVKGGEREKRVRDVCRNRRRA